MRKKEQEGSPYEIPPPYGDGDIPEIDLPGKANTSNDIPNEFPGHNNQGVKQTL